MGKIDFKVMLLICITVLIIGAIGVFGMLKLDSTRADREALLVEQAIEDYKANDEYGTFEEIPAEERTDSKKDKKTNTKKDKVKQEKVKKAEPKKAEVTNGPDQFGNIYIAPTDAYPDTTAVKRDDINEGLIIRKIASGKNITLDNGVLRDFVEEDTDTTPTEEEARRFEEEEIYMPTRAERIESTKIMYQEEDDKLNYYWGELKATLSEDRMSALLAEQQEWLTERDAVSAEQAVLAGGGEEGEEDRINSLYGFTESRVYKLEWYLNNGY